MTLYDIGYVDVEKMLVWFNINGVIDGCQVDWYLIRTTMWPMLGYMTWILYTCTLGNLVMIFGIIG
jgi:hypothetical protein